MIDKSDVKISVIVPVYNCEKFLRKCISSILNQSFKEFELILIDDGSTDSSGAICDEFAKCDNRVVVRHKENGGVCSARNLGLNIARGEYIGFSDCDDLMNKYMYEKLYTAAIKEHADIALCYCKTFFEDNINCEKLSEVNFINVDKEFIYKNIYGKGNIDYQYMVVWNKLINRKLFKNIRFDDNGVEDLSVMNRIFNLSRNIILTQAPLYFWRQHNYSLSHRRFNERNILILQTYENCYKYLKDNSKEKFADMCINKLIRVALNTKYNSKNSALESDALYVVNNQFKEYYNVFLKSKYISIKDKIIFSIFRFIPFTYDIFRRINER